MSVLCSEPSSRLCRSLKVSGSLGSGKELDKMDTVDNAVMPWTKTSCFVAGFRFFPIGEQESFCGTGGRDSISEQSLLNNENIQSLRVELLIIVFFQNMCRCVCVSQNDQSPTMDQE